MYNAFQQIRSLRCTQCRRPAPAGAVCCGRCGCRELVEEFAGVGQGMVFCRRCGGNHDPQDGNAFCGTCGEPRRLTAAVVRPAPAPAPKMAAPPPRKSRSPAFVALGLLVVLGTAARFFSTIQHDTTTVRSATEVSAPQVVQERIVVERPVHIQQPMSPVMPNYQQQLYPGRGRGSAAIPRLGATGVDPFGMPNVGVPGINRSAYQTPGRVVPGVTIPGVNYPRVPGSPMTIDQFGRPVYPTTPGTRVDPFSPFP